MKPFSVLSRSFIVVGFIITGSVLSGCNEDSHGSLLFNSPHVRLIGQPTMYIDSTFHFVNISVTVQNDGDGPTAFDIGYSIKLKKGNHIVDQTGLYFGTLKQGETITEKRWFTKIESLTEYDNIEAVLYWYDAENRYYQ